jgi:hypothetical protein
LNYTLVGQCKINRSWHSETFKITDPTILRIFYNVPLHFLAIDKKNLNEQMGRTYLKLNQALAWKE